MEKINKLIKKRLTNEENKNNINTNNLLSTISTQSINFPKEKEQINYYKYTEVLQNQNININSIINDNPINIYHRQLIIAKIIISELQENISNTISEKQQIESQLNEALNSIKSLHNDYISLTEKISLVNKNINIEPINNLNSANKENNNIINDLEKKIKEIEEEKTN